MKRTMTVIGLGLVLGLAWGLALGGEFDPKAVDLDALKREVTAVEGDIARREKIVLEYEDAIRRWETQGNNPQQVKELRKSLGRERTELRNQQIKIKVLRPRLDQALTAQNPKAAAEKEFSEARAGLDAARAALKAAEERMVKATEALKAAGAAAPDGEPR